MPEIVFSGDMHVDANIELNSPCHSHSVRVDENVSPTHACHSHNHSHANLVCGAAR